MKKCLPIFAIVLIGWLALTLSGCDDEMGPAMDPIVDAVTDDTPRPEPVTPPKSDPTPQTACALTAYRGTAPCWDGCLCGTETNRLPHCRAATDGQY